MPSLKPRIPKAEFEMRIANIKKLMQRDKLDAVLVYGDEYRKENLRYVSNYWPIFERAALLIGRDDAPILLCAPEGKKIADEMSTWPDIRLLPDFLCVTVPDEIDYPHANYTSFADLAKNINGGAKVQRLGVVGEDAMSMQLYNRIKAAFACELVNANNILFELRLNKSENEIACLKEAARIADVACKTMLEADIIGKTERYAAGLAEGEARKAGAEAILFTVMGSGERTNAIVGRAAEKIIEDGDMIMFGIAVQYEGYVATSEIPFAVGNISKDTQRTLDVLFEASRRGVAQLKPGNKMKNMVTAVRDCFREAGLEKYDVYPPLHGIGCAEAESPYPDENTEEVFTVGMTMNTDISLFGLPGGSNRIEEGFVITENGAQTLSPYIRQYCEKLEKK